MRTLCLIAALTFAPCAASAQMAMGEMDMAGVDHSGMDHGPTVMPSAYGDFPMNRDGGAGSWVPDATPMMVMRHSGQWMISSHAVLDVVADRQSGPRGDEKLFTAGYVMWMAQRPVGAGRLGFEAMLSPDPLMGKAGYPLLLAAGESADGSTELVDRQHPHDLFMELAASYSRPLGRGVGGFIYAGLPGAPAFGPPAFMHRPAGAVSPEAPLSHHWLDSTHITYGVATLGLTSARWKLEASAFRGREPDEQRYDIETGALDSGAVRVSFNPSPNWALQASYAGVKSPEALHPDEDETRSSVSALYGRALGSGRLDLTFAYGRKAHDGEAPTTAWLAEGAWSPTPRWTLFARAEQVAPDHISTAGDPPTVRKLSVGAARSWAVSDRAQIQLGGLVSGFDIPAGVTPSYGDPSGAMAFLRFKFNPPH